MSARLIDHQNYMLSQAVYTDGKYQVSFGRLIHDDKGPAEDAIFVKDADTDLGETLIFACDTRDLLQVSAEGDHIYRSYKRFNGYDGGGIMHTHFTQHVRKEKDSPLRRSQYLAKDSETPTFWQSSGITEDNVFHAFVDEKELMTRVENILINANDLMVPPKLLKQKTLALRYIAENKERDFPVVHPFP